MCVNIIVDDGADGVLCTNHGELAEALGGAPVYHPDVDFRDITDADCLCGIDQAATALQHGFRINGRDDFGDVILAKVRH